MSGQRDDHESSYNFVVFYNDYLAITGTRE